MAVRQFELPDLGEGLEDAEVVSWRVAEGDHVELNQVLVEVNTAKALVEIPSPWEGLVEKLHAGEGDVVRVGQALITIRVDEADATTQAAMETGQGAAGEARPRRQAVLVGYGVEEEEKPTRRVGPSEDGGTADRRRVAPVPASPPVRRLAKELGVDLATIQGSGPEGRVTREDVMHAAGGVEPGDDVREDRRATAPEPARGPTAAAGEDRSIPVRGTRRLIAEKMARSVREIPHVTTFLTVDASWLQALREEIAAGTGERISPLPIVVRALADVTRAHPKLSASFDGERSEILLRGRFHVGIATDTDQGLIVPVVRDADALGIVELAREIARLTEAARAGRAQPQELVGSTITVTNVGTFGAEFGTPIINHPEAAILALGVVEPRALVVDEQVQARSAVTLSLSFDHRVLDGAEAGRALRALADLLENPLRLGALPR